MNLRLWPVAFPVFVGLGLLCARPNPLAGADVTLYGLIKSQRYVQTNEAAPVVQGSNAFGLVALVLAGAPGAVTNASFTPQGRPGRQLMLDGNRASLRFEFATNSQANLDALFPSPTFGNPSPYSFVMQTVSDGSRTSVVTLPNLLGSPIYPPLLTVQNVAQLQSVDHTLNLNLRWSASGANTLQLVQALILDRSSNIVFATPAPFAEGALNGSSNAIVVPAGTLPAGTDLELHVTIAQPGFPNTNDYPGAMGIGAFAKDTAVPIRTRPSPPPPFLYLAPTAVQGMKVWVEAESNRLCHLEASGDFAGWTNLLSTNTGTGTVDYLESGAVHAGPRFYRARLGQ